MRWPGLVGSAGSLLAAWLSLTPSLLPRPPLVQGVTTGLAAAVGLGVAELLAWLVRELRRVVGRPTDDASRPGPVARRRPVAAPVIAAALASAVALWCWSEWQQDLRTLMDMPPLPVAAPLVVVSVAPVVAAAFVLAGRVLRRVVTAARAWLVARLARAAVVAIEAVVVLGLAMLVLSGAAIDLLTAPVGAVYAQIDRGTAAGVSEPSSSLRSGGPGSAVDWDGLGLEGRSFVAGGPHPEELRQFADEGAQEPIRVYAGLRSADDLAAEARLVVEELDRTGAWDRQVVAVYTSTGTGLVDPDVVDGLELLWGGDTAIASMQYSYLPSWLAFLGDRESAADAGRVLIDAVRSRWEELPPQDRPELVVVGESLGSYGTESAFRDAEQLAGRVDAAYFIGPPFMSPIWQELVEERDPDSPVWLPEVGAGEQVRFANGREQLVAPFPEWADRRILYLDHGSDPVTWWSPGLAWSRPEWLEGERAPDVSDAIVWLPVVTFLQTAVDLADAQSVPVGHGHRYGATIADGWAALLPPPGWTQEDTERLHDWMQRR